MSKKVDQSKSILVYQLDPTECPFREFRDNEMHIDYWGKGPAAFRAAVLSKAVVKPPADYVWVDEQIQPLPRSVRKYLHGWIRAEELATDRWGAETVIFEENDGGMMVLIDIQLSHTQVLQRSSFCRKVLSTCFVLERTEGLLIEHQWENFIFAMGPEGWRARYHIYSPGMKAGGGQQHRPALSKNGCYLVRLYYLGAWRCVWVSDRVPVDATDSPLLPFSPLLSPIPKQIPQPNIKQAPPVVTSTTVHLWPLLICKALLKLAAPDMNSDEEVDSCEDELMLDFDIIHALTGSITMNYDVKGYEHLWNLLTREVTVFGWDDDDDTMASTVKSKAAKKPTTKVATAIRKGSATVMQICDSKNHPPYHLPGITPAHEMYLLISMARDVPLKKPLPEPEVALWKHYRWIDWARRHGLYDTYACPRTKFLKVNGLMKLSYSPHLLDMQSTESITFGYREEHDKTTGNPTGKKMPKETKSAAAINVGALSQQKEELREWILYDQIFSLTMGVQIAYFPSMYQFTSAASSPPLRITRAPLNRAFDMPAPKSAPLYLQLDGPDENVIRIALSMLHPRILFNCGVPIVEYIEPAYMILERFEWFVDCEIPKAKAFVVTRGYDSVEFSLEPGRHFCRIWVHSRMNWHLMLLSDSSLLLGTRDLIQSAAVHECPWVSRFLSNLSQAFINWTRGPRSITTVNIIMADRDFFNSYEPDLTWDNEVVGYDKSLLHWMFRQALQSLLIKKLQKPDFDAVCTVLRRYFCDPDFGLPKKPIPPKSLRDIVNLDPCDCVMPIPEAEEAEEIEEQLEEQVGEEKPLVDKEKMTELLKVPSPPAVSQLCELATEDLPCGVLREEREKEIKRHEAATVLQAHWRGTWARKCLTSLVNFTPDVTKVIMDNVFGNLESLSALMNEFFGMYPGAKYAYSVSSALSGVYGLNQHHGSAPIYPKCVWIPYFQGVFYCHEPVKVHFDVQSSLTHSTFAIYDNDTGIQLPQSYNSHITFEISPNVYGYTVMGHGSLKDATGTNMEVHWQLTVLTNIDGVFHVCDNDLEGCHVQPLPTAYKLHIDEIFIPNRRNILGGITIAVTKHEAVSFRAAATSPELEIEAILRSTYGARVEELGRCAGVGEIYWPYIRLEPTLEIISSYHKQASSSHGNFKDHHHDSLASARQLKTSKSSKAPPSGKKSATKLKNVPLEPKQYTIEVVAKNGWPLTLAQWKRVDEVRNSVENKVDIAKKPVKDKPGSAKEKEKEKAFQPVFAAPQPQPDDAYVELECSVSLGGGAACRRDDQRDIEFANARRGWDSNEPGRNLRGAQIRKDFRAEFLEALPPPPSESVHSYEEELFGEQMVEGEEKAQTPQQQGPTPATESVELEMSIESEEEAKYLTMPDQLRDKFVPLYFLPFCTKEKNEEDSVMVTQEMAEAAKQDRHARIEAALERMRELQSYNETYVLGRQKRRCSLLDKLFVDGQWNMELMQVLEERDDAIALETLNRTLSATKKKADAKKK